MTNVELEWTVNELILVAMETIYIKLSRQMTAPLLVSSSSTGYDCISRSLSSFKLILPIGSMVSPFTKQAFLFSG